jgi:hypothetical protein
VAADVPGGNKGKMARKLSRAEIFIYIVIFVLIAIFYNPSKDDTPQSERDKYGLLISDYDKNGWAKVRGEWVSNPRDGALIVYSNGIATSSTRVGSVVQNNSSVNPYRNFSSMRETYPILERVARDLEYSDIPALWDSFNQYKPLRDGYYLELDGYKFYDHQAYFEYKIQRAKAWGSRNDLTGDDVINCQDYAELFYRYASEAGYHVRYVTNDGLNHAFNAVNINGSWITIEPQAAEDKGLDKSPRMSEHWENYDPSYDTIRKQM